MNFRICLVTTIESSKAAGTKRKKGGGGKGKKSGKKAKKGGKQASSNPGTPQQSLDPNTATSADLCLSLGLLDPPALEYTQDDLTTITSLKVAHLVSLLMSEYIAFTVFVIES